MYRYHAVDQAIPLAKDNIRRILAMATDEELHRGLTWYDSTREWLTELADECGLTLETTAKVFAALSPNNRIDSNLWDTRQVCLALTKANAEHAFDQIRVSTFRANKEKAGRIVLGEDCLSGPKVTSFAQNLLGDLDAVTVDRHAFNAACGAVYISDKRGPTITKRRYKLIAKAYREVAEEYNLAPCEVQAIVWLVWKRIIRR